MSTLYIVATPIGNLQDITLRAVEVLQSVDVIICEDTRVTRKLLSHFDIDKPLLSYHQHSTGDVVKKISGFIENNNNMAYVSDAGTPGIQDPGNNLISLLILSEPEIDKLRIVPVPGASAVTAIASVSGLPTDSFVFFGFIPKKKGKQKVIQEIINSKRTAIFYESGHRIIKTLENLSELGDRKVVVGRELTKKFETIYRGAVEEVICQIKNTSAKGEFVVVVEALS